MSSFLVIRIVYHIIILIDVLRPVSRHIMHDAYVPIILIALALGLHVSWFRGGLTGYLKRRQTKAKAKKSNEDKATIDHPTIADEAKIDRPVLYPPSTSPQMIATTEPTPEDSPLVTPYTPSQTPMTLRDSYILNNIPTLTLPTQLIPSLSDITAALPKSVRDRQPINFGFRDAVKSRWEEQKGRFGPAGRGMGFTLGGLGLRRRNPGSAPRNEDDGSVDGEPEGAVEDS